MTESKKLDLISAKLDKILRQVEKNEGGLRVIELKIDALTDELGLDKDVARNIRARKTI